jgi:very-short-patch-repair endonuclease
MESTPKATNSHLLPTLERFRNKLLDLTSRNKLLNLSLDNKRTARLIRFIACDPQSVLDTLCSGEQLKLKALSDPPEEEKRRIEGEEVEAPLIDAKSQKTPSEEIVADGPSENNINPVAFPAEDLPHSKVRNEFEKASKNSSTKHLAKWAETQGINPSYDLSFSEKSRPRKDDTLQVLMLAQRLERLAEGMRRNARSSIEETGNNILYLAFGSLEWSEKDKIFTAPLVLLPVEMIRSSSRGGWKSFSLTGTEDAPVGNFTLKERLRRDFLIDLPLPSLTEDGGDLNAYFEEVTEAIAEIQGWTVRVNLSLALLNFSGLGLYEDLDPRILQSSDLVRQLLAAEISDGKQCNDSKVIAEDVNVDQVSVSEKVPILITQADASQFASIADVMSGRSMVIEGPPGTGKSQTITNIIANALYAGQRVLFVAEKKVALDVVYTRLAEAGLKPYCLRIASDKTSKREVYDELAQRLRLPSPNPPRRDAVLSEFNQLRDQLNNFSELINQGHGAEEETHQELLWTELKLKQELQHANIELAEFKIDLPASTSYHRPHVDRVAETYAELADLVTSIDIDRLHDVFVSIGSRPADSLGRDQLFDQAQRWADSLKRLTKLVNVDEDSRDLSLQALRRHARKDAEEVSRLPNPLSSDLEIHINLLASAEISGTAQGYFQALRAEQASADKLASSFVRIPNPLPETAQVKDFVNRWNAWSIGHLSMPLRAEERNLLGQRLEVLRDQVERLEIVYDAMGYPGPEVKQLNHSAVQSLARVLEHLTALPERMLGQRSQPIWTADSNYVRDLLSRNETLEHQRKSLGLENSSLIRNYSAADLKQASRVLQHCCARGMADLLLSSAGGEEWCLRISEVEALLRRIQIVVEQWVESHSLSSFTLEQLQALPNVLRSVVALGPEIVEHRNGQFWDAPLDAMVSTLQAKKELYSKRSELERDQLVIPTDVDAKTLREEAEVIETRKGLHKLVSGLAGSYKRASELAEKLGIKKDSQRAIAMRRLADFLDQQANFPAEQASEWCSEGLGLEDAVSVAQKLAILKSQISAQSTTAEFVPLVCDLPFADVRQLLACFEGGLENDINELLANRLWAGNPVVKLTLAELHSQLDVCHRDKELLALAAPFAALAVAAGIRNGDEMATWFEKVQQFQERELHFPLAELQAIVGPIGDTQQHHEVLAAAETYKELLSDGKLENMQPLLLGLSKPELESLSGLLTRQLIPLLNQMMAEEDLINMEREQQPTTELIANIIERTTDFHQLINDWAGLGLQDGMSYSTLFEVPLDLELYIRRQAAVVSATADLHQLLGPDLSHVSPTKLRAVLDWIVRLRELRLPLLMEQCCLKQGSSDYITSQRARGLELISAVEREEEEARQFTALAEFKPQIPGDDMVKDATAMHHRDLADWLALVLSLRNSFPLWLRFLHLMDTLPSKVDRRLVHALIDGNISAVHWRTIYHWNVVRSKLGEISDANPALKVLQASDQVARRKRFDYTEDQLMKLDRAEVIAKIHRDRHELPVGINQGKRGEFTDLGLIDNEVNKQKRHRPLRHLFRYAGQALRGLKPCWMMSPSTVASLVPRNAIEQFDLVIVDEASQMAPERAFGVISRAKQLVVVGDPKQLPPTDFFTRSYSSEELEESDEVDSEALDEESILDLCTKSFRPVRRLKWHYRSRHGSLIAFSNRQFYDNHLVVFPSCNRDFAINRHLVESPRYIKKINSPEATLLCDVVLEQLKLYPGFSLGVVAMNELQAEEILEQLERLSTHHEELRRRLDITDSSEELFVKSLEKVQGDERDTIVISTTYGPSESGGRLAMRFGPINFSGGHRRLNVLFTRAKHRIELVTSMESSQIHPTATSSQGVHALKAYLKYVETRNLDTGRNTGRPPDSEFEVVVAEALERYGYKVECQVGVANYFIDLAIVHPTQSGLYLLGVECDGATYHSARAARDRDKYRQSVLESLGWKIYRIWSTDWFENAEAETKKLVDFINGLIGS